MPIWAFLKSKKKNKIHEPTAQHRRANSSGQNPAAHLHLGDKGLSFKDAAVPVFAREEQKWFMRKVKEAVISFFGHWTRGRDLSAGRHQQCCPPQLSQLSTPNNIMSSLLFMMQMTTNKEYLKKYLNIHMFLTFRENSKDKRLKKPHTSPWQWCLKNSNLKFSEVSSVFRQLCSKTGMQQILWLPRTFHYTSAKRPSQLKLQAFELGGVLWSF